MFRTLLSFLLLYGCEFSQNSINKSRSSSNATESELVGVWKTNCVNVSGESYQLQLGFSSSGEVVLSENFYYGVGCSEDDALWKTAFDYTKVDHQLTLVRNFVGITPLHADTVTTNNNPGDEWCGIDDWSIGVERDVTNLDCEVFGSGNEPSTTNYSIVSGELTFTGEPLLENETFFKE